ncbi:MAG: LysE type translocator family protein [Phenylobacterium sp.]|nr:LysE type translocator family protein [Phenylobacterium sp.]
MDWRVWLGFVAASATMGVIPGPGVTAIVGYALSSGRRPALASVAGMALGNAAAMTLSLAGAGAVLAASALAFSILKWAGAIYLVTLGVIAVARARKAAEAAAANRAPISAKTAFWSNVAVGTFHPKTIVFFVAFAPQFISARAPYAPQAAMLIATFVGVVGLTDTGYALAAARAARLLSGPKAMLWSKRAGGGALIAAGLATAAART